MQTETKILIGIAATAVAYYLYQQRPQGSPERTMFLRQRAEAKLIKERKKEAAAAEAYARLSPQEKQRRKEAVEKRKRTDYLISQLPSDLKGLRRQFESSKILGYVEQDADYTEWLRGLACPGRGMSPHHLMSVMLPMPNLAAKEELLGLGISDPCAKTEEADPVGYLGSYF